MAKDKKVDNEVEKKETPKGFGGNAPRKDKDLLLFTGKKKVVFEHTTSVSAIRNSTKPLEPDGAIRVTQTIKKVKIQTIVNINNFSHWRYRDHKSEKKAK